MQSGFFQVFTYPIISGVVLLFVEYFAIQPWLRYKETRVPKLEKLDSRNSKRKWSDGIKNAIIQFKKVTDTYKWSGFSLKQNFIVISSMTIYKGQAELTLTITERYVLGKLKEIAEFYIIIDRVGDISHLETLPFEYDVNRDTNRLKRNKNSIHSKLHHIWYFQTQNGFGTNIRIWGFLPITSDIPIYLV